MQYDYIQTSDIFKWRPNNVFYLERRRRRMTATYPPGEGGGVDAVVGRKEEERPRRTVRNFAGRTYRVITVDRMATDFQDCCEMTVTQIENVCRISWWNRGGGGAAKVEGHYIS